MARKSRIATDGGSENLLQNPFQTLGDLAVTASASTAAPTPAASSLASAKVAPSSALPPGAKPTGQSAGPGPTPPSATRPAESFSCRGRVELRREKAGRGGKTVTTARGPIFTAIGPQQRAELLRVLQGQLGTGGLALPDGLELRGDCRDAVETFLRQHGATVVRAGG